MSIPHKAYYNAFNLIPHIGPIRFNKIKNHFINIEDAWNSNLKDFLKTGIEEKIVYKIFENKKEIDIEKEWIKLQKENIEIIIKNDNNYPKDLKEIASSPEILYLKGELPQKDFYFAIVGSRKVSTYGKRIAEDFSKSLSEAGFNIVSGMAYGVDSIAQNECIKLKKKTVAVLAGGLDEKNIYPASNRTLAKKISEYGCLISEYPLGSPPLRQNFPARNRIISGLSKGVLIVEASQSSGSLITANFALEQNREVFAVPGSIYSDNSKGTNNLIKMGAKIVTKTEDILEEFNIILEKNTQTVDIKPKNKEEELILKNLSKESPTHIDNLSKITQIKTSALSSILTMMEIRGIVINIGGMRYIKK